MTSEPSAATIDLLLKGGHVIDPASGLTGVADVAIAGGRIAQVAPDISPATARKVLDATGRYVTPGIIDMHVHCTPYHETSTYSIWPDVHTFSAGVTTVVDAGTVGWRDFVKFKELVIDRARARVLAFVNIVGSGMGGDCEHEAPEMQPTLAAGIALAFPDVVVGIKTAHYWTRHPFDASHLPWTSVDRAVEAGDICHKPVMVDFWPRLPERPYPDLILKHLRPGDIHTHVFAQQFPVLDANRRLNPCYAEARERGVIFDLGHGSGSFWFRNAVPAFQQGFWPDSISTDLHTHSVLGPVFDMLTTMNKCLNMGMPLTEVIARSTVAPAREIGHPELGTLRVGAEADVAVFDLEQGRFPFWDCGRAKLWGSQRLVCKYTLRAGQVVHDPDGWDLPEWEQAPAPYWVNPALQAPSA